MYPTEFQVQRFAYRGGWVVRQGDSLSFLAREGPSKLQYSAPVDSVIQIGRDAYVLPATKGYGEVRVVLHNTDTKTPFLVEPGMRIAQLVVLPIPELELVEVDELPSSERGVRGFGSSAT